jgi:glycerate 2-kinase
MPAEELLAIYRGALELTDPRRLVHAVLRRLALPRTAVDVVALGKSAGPMLLGVVERHIVSRAFAAVPAGYEGSLAAEWPAGVPLELALGTHPQLSPASFDAGARLMEFVRASSSPLVVLISGGASASVEQPIPPFDADDLTHANQVLVASGIPIGEINAVRKHLSAIKGGRLVLMAKHLAATLILSDVGEGKLADVGSGPTLADPTTNAHAASILRATGDERCTWIAERLLQDAPETIKDVPPHPVELIADNATLVRSARFAASASGFEVAVSRDQIECPVADAARLLADRARGLGLRQIFIAGGEPTVRVNGPGRGGRCSELAVRFAQLLAQDPPRFDMGDLYGLFAGSDGVDGNSGAAGVIAFPARVKELASGTEIDEALRQSNSYSVAERIGEPIIIPPTGNNLRDLFLLARG